MAIATCLGLMYLVQPWTLQHLFEAFTGHPGTIGGRKTWLSVSLICLARRKSGRYLAWSLVLVIYSITIHYFGQCFAAASKSCWSESNLLIRSGHEWRRPMPDWCRNALETFDQYQKRFEGYDADKI